jgi:acetyl/propionyl-CoA carboxylase alpha subunit
LKKHKAANGMGYPVMLKATAGVEEKECVPFGNGRFIKSMGSARQESAAAFGTMVCTWKN